MNEQVLEKYSQLEADSKGSPSYQAICLLISLLSLFLSFLLAFFFKDEGGPFIMTYVAFITFLYFLVAIPLIVISLFVKNKVINTTIIVLLVVITLFKICLDFSFVWVFPS